jgi:hypothetical protein
MQEYYISKDNARTANDIPVVLLTLNAMVKGSNVQQDEPFTFIAPLSQDELDKVYAYCFDRGYILNKVYTI